jgi:hypothetical protein
MIYVSHSMDKRRTVLGSWIYESMIFYGMVGEVCEADGVE